MPLQRPPIEPDPVIEAYKKDVDRTLLRENLKRSVTLPSDKQMLNDGFFFVTFNNGQI